MPEPDNTKTLRSRRIILGVCGGIAAYKIAHLVRLFKKGGAEVQVLMTEDAGRFVTPLTLGTLSEREVLSEIFPENDDGSWTKHIHLGLWADLFVVAPATAQTISKLANGISDSMLTATALAARCPVLVCLAMDHDMYVHPATQKNLEELQTYGYDVMKPGFGELASGLIGEGRLPEPEEIVDAAVERIAQRLAEREGILSGKRVLVTAGPTREAVDPVRFLSNHSTGKMGFALAAAAAEMGADVVLVSGPTSLETPEGVNRVDVVSAEDMFEAVQTESDSDVVIMAAAVADYTTVTTADNKLKKADDDLSLSLRRTKDILKSLGKIKRPGQLLVGFALETENELANAQRKLQEKNLDMIVLNNPKDDGAGFATDTNRVTMLFSDGREESLPVLPKTRVAELILEAAVALEPEL